MGPAQPLPLFGTVAVTDTGTMSPYSNRLRACLTCRRTFVAIGNERHCPTHQAAWQRRRNAAARTRRPRDYPERVEHTEIIQDWVLVHGWVCPGLDQHIAHQVEPGRLTVHHLNAVAEGGSRVGGPKTVLCRSENSRLGGEVRRRR
jgi:hypothetical protein